MGNEAGRYFPFHPRITGSERETLLLQHSLINLKPITREIIGFKLISSGMH